MSTKEEIKIINRRMEETLGILLEHFKEMEERMETLENKKCKCKSKINYLRNINLQLISGESL